MVATANVRITSRVVVYSSRSHALNWSCNLLIYANDQTESVAQLYLNIVIVPLPLYTGIKLLT